MTALDRATVELPATQSNADIASFPVLRLDFTLGTAADVGLSPNRARVVRNPEGKGRCLSIKPMGGRPPAIVVGAKPNTFYRVRQQKGGNSVKLSVLEMKPQIASKKVNAPSDLNRVLSKAPMAGSYAKLGELIKQRPFPADQDVMEIFTSSTTHSLLLLFESEGRGAPTCFHSIGVEELQPGPQARWALVQKRFGLQGNQIATFGQLLPAPVQKEPGFEVERAWAYQDALLLPAQGRVSLTLRPPVGSHLSFQIARLAESGADAEANAWVEVNNERLWEQQVTDVWQPVDLQLPPGEISVRLGVDSDGPGAITAWGTPVIWPPRTQEAPPDVFVIAVDTLRADRLQIYGYERRTSPHLAALAKDSVVFEQAIAQSNWTPESFAAVFSSSYSGQHGVTRRLSVLESNRWAAAMRAAGYFTDAVAYKLLLYNMGFERGFDHYLNIPSFHLSSGYSVLGEKNLAWAERWLTRHASRPSFFFLHLNDPHQPFNHPEAQRFTYAEQKPYRRHKLDWPILIQSKRITSGPEQRRCATCAPGNRFARDFKALANDLYDEEILYTDAMVGRFLDRLRKEGRYHNSLIVLFSDHGEGLMDHEDYLGHGFHHMYEELVRVPLLIKPPRGSAIAPGRVPTQVRLIDIMPTVLDMLDLAVPEQVEGRSLVPVMLGDEKDDRPAVTENVDAQTVSWRERRFKYVARYKGSRPREVLYNLREDPGETSPIRDEEQLAPYRKRVAEHLTRTRSGGFVWLVADGKVTARLTPGAELWLGKPRGTLARLWRVQEETAPVLKIGGKRYTLGDVNSWPAAGSSSWQELAPGVNVKTVYNGARAHETKEGLAGDQLQALEALGYIVE